MGGSWRNNNCEIFYKNFLRKYENLFLIFGNIINKFITVYFIETLM